jgi:hypothetical protein
LQGSEAIIGVNYRSILSSERVFNKPAVVGQKAKTGHVLQMGAREEDRLAE